MIKQILVALDADTKTPIAMGCAIEIAQRHSAELTGMAIVDRVECIRADVLALGAHVVSTLKKLVFGSTSASLFQQVNIPMWLKA